MEMLPCTWYTYNLLIRTACLLTWLHTIPYLLLIETSMVLYLNVPFAFTEKMLQRKRSRCWWEDFLDALRCRDWKEIQKLWWEDSGKHPLPENRNRKLKNQKTGKALRQVLHRLCNQSNQFDQIWLNLGA